MAHGTPGIEGHAHEQPRATIPLSCGQALGRATCTFPSREPPWSAEDPMPLAAVYHRAIVAALRSMGGSTTARIAEATGLPLQRVDTAVRRLVHCTEHPSINGRRAQPDRRDR